MLGGNETGLRIEEVVWRGRVCGSGLLGLGLLNGRVPKRGILEVREEICASRTAACRAQIEFEGRLLDVSTTRHSAM